MKKEKNLWTYIILIVLLIVLSLPLISLIGSSFKPEAESLNNTSLMPHEFTLDNYKYVFTKTTLLGNIINSVIISLTVTIACILTGAFAGYALSRFRGKVFSFYKLFLYMLQMLPMVLLLIPLFIMIRLANLYDTLYSVIISYTAINLPICIWILKGFFDTIPTSIEESALMDGCGRLKTFIKIIVPVSTPGITSVGILSFVYAWNEYMLGSIFIRSEELTQLTVGLSQFAMRNNIIWSHLTAGAVVGLIPAVIFIVLAQKYIVSGLVAGAVKG